ncbi:hypothetical protein PTRG_06013 [Pyrenophora tritici-repentis Pt-1C-BFP]|uniref:UmuC domain-containing protein n=1 Tax=Pyrenophora tritici-repentis (strain Pt-1C-BFP) TaxID=426418 RepID=B2W875_PYRTR|nr:uncharacterized protein PTRG_06013 [Pyrenophora tritici-repentis Pt-1C-BFP]EDU48933.1 hypothetical protein PTRG_06013 [Pyrenophora tritici-repentis Pt-1C-BFP]
MPKRQLQPIILHFVRLCTYSCPCATALAQSGLRKLQLIHEAKRVCPDVVIVLGEDLTRFRDASKHLYAFLRSFSWNSRCERLGFDERLVYLPPTWYKTVMHVHCYRTSRDHIVGSATSSIGSG